MIKHGVWTILIDNPKDCCWNLFKSLLILLWKHASMVALIIDYNLLLFSTPLQRRFFRRVSHFTSLTKAGSNTVLNCEFHQKAWCRWIIFMNLEINITSFFYNFKRDNFWLPFFKKTSGGQRKKESILSLVSSSYNIQISKHFIEIRLWNP